jgi:Fe-S-cluster-containing hydrogenase component 2/CRP-like cAMP-binding protein
MAKIVTNIPPEFEQVAAPIGPEDELLTAKELESLSIFVSLKKAPSFEKFPGFTLLRKCHPKRVLCEQGTAGATAFSILTTQDVIDLREIQLKSIRLELEARAEGKSREDLHPQFARLTLDELLSRETECLQEIADLRPKATELERPENKDKMEMRRRASAHLLVNLEGGGKRGSWWRRATGWLTGHRRKRRRAIPKSIAIDGANVNAKTKVGGLYEGDLFGEMSCLNRAPRSATVVADNECYMLEMLRNVLDMLHKDPVYKERMDGIYRKRVLEGHIRRLSIFEELSDAEYAKLHDAIELIEVPTGDLVFEEFDPSDAFYVIRSGLVKVVANAWTQLRATEFLNVQQWIGIAEDLLASPEDDVARKVAGALTAATRQAAESIVAAKLLSDSDRTALVAGLNQFIVQGALHLQFGKTTTEVAATVNSPALLVAMSDFPDNPKDWSELERRTFHRLLLEHVFANMPERGATAGPRRTLSYLGRGDFFGETGVMKREPRSATVYAYDHPDGGANMRIPDSRTGAVPSRVELVKISKVAFQELLASSLSVHQRVEKVIAARQQKSEVHTKSDTTAFVSTQAQSAAFEQLGLVQGQKLMLIDLDRCTRCNQCVDACVAAHDDGRTRLYLDGPRFENFLVPITCRSCLDPVCMIGCPVGSINRGDLGEIVIEDWCIGCGVCADQCPYGSILMNPLTKPLEFNDRARLVLEAGSEVRSIVEQAVVCDLCSALPSQQPSCVYACPHDAALRVNAQDFFLSGNR